MSDEAHDSAASYDHLAVLRELEGVIAGYKSPDDLEQLMKGSWMDIASTLLELFGEESDPWRRMVWFTRIVCNAINTSLARGDAESLEQALHTFMIWMRLCNEETESLDLALVAAEYLCKRLKIQMMASLGSNEPNEEIETADLVPKVSENDVPASEQAQLHGSQSAEEVQPQKLEDELQEDNIAIIHPEPNQLQALGATKPDGEPGLGQGPGPEPMQEAEPVPASPSPDTPLNFTEYAGPQYLSEPLGSPQAPGPESWVGQVEREADSTPPEDHPNAQPITTSAGDIPMDIPTLSEKLHTPLDKEPDSTTGRESPQATERPAADRSKSTIVPVGIWLGFHDEDVSTMVKLAVYDRANDNYIFANKQGFLVRQMNTPDLLNLIENQLVDIIERRLVTRKPVA